MRSQRVIALAAVLLALGAYAAAFVSLMRQRQHDISWFVVAGSRGIDPARIPPGLSIIPGVEGYDGVAFYRLALDPFTRQETQFGITLDNPPFRQQRILYPLIVHVLSLGRAEWVPTLLVVVNFAAVAALTLGGAWIAAQHGLNPAWGLLLPLYPGFFITFSRNTSELVAWAFAILAIGAWGARRWTAATILLSCAVLTRETTLGLAVALAAAYAWERLRRRERSFPAIVFVAPIAIYVAWQLTLRAWWGTSPLASGALQPAVPFSGYLAVFAEAAARKTVLLRVHFAECVLWAIVVACAAGAIVRKGGALPWRLAWVGYLALGAILGRDIWHEHIGFMRIISDLYAMSAVLLFAAPRAVRWIVLVATAAVSYYAMSHMR